jgi:2-dehydro-3-deoxygluconokinase
MKYDLATFGETMVRISVRAGENLDNTTSADLFTGGTESNTAVALARLGMKTAWISRLTDNPLGLRIASDIARHGVNTEKIVWTSEDRAGVYFVEFAAPPRASNVIYDRRNSAISKLKPEEIDWKFLLDTRLLHLTGITPALSPSCAKAVSEAVAKARAKKVPVSFDVNYRAKLWSPAAAAKTLAPLISNSTLLTMTLDDAATVFKFNGEPECIVREIRKTFRARAAVLTMGNKGTLAWDGETLFQEPGYRLSEAVDRLGAGDAFTAGIIYGFLKNDLSLGLKYGIAMSAMKIGMRGDYFWASRSEVEQAIAGRGSDVKR